MQEVNIMRAIPKHPNVLELIEALDDNNGRRSVILPMMSCSLETLYDSSGIIAPVVLKQYICQIAAGIAHMHKSGIAHLDLKCANVLMTSSNLCKICDFGMASQFSGNATAVFKGTHSFMAPEVWSESRDCDFTKIDVFALGMVIWELLAAQHPWSRLYDGLDIEKWRLDIKVKVLANVRPDLDKRWDSSLSSLMVRCWDQEPSRRPAAADIILSLA
jgi:serine/threonine protein kinase